MVAFRNVVDGTPVQHWWSGGDFQIAFSRYIRTYSYLLFIAPIIRWYVLSFVNK